MKFWKARYSSMFYLFDHGVKLLKANNFCYHDLSLLSNEENNLGQS